MLPYNFINFKINYYFLSFISTKDFGGKKRNLSNCSVKKNVNAKSDNITVV